MAEADPPAVAAGMGGKAESLTARLALWSAHRARWVVLAWVLVVVLALGTCVVSPANTDVEYGSPGESGRALKLMQERFNRELSPAEEVVVFSSPAHSVDDGVYRQTVEGLMTDLSRLRSTEAETVQGTRVVSAKRVVTGTLTNYDVGLPSDASPFVAPDAGGGGDVSLGLVTLAGDPVQAQDDVDSVVDTVKNAERAAPNFTISSGGGASLFKQNMDVVEQDMAFALVLNLVVTTAILVLVFRAVVAAVIPLALAMAAIITAFGILALTSQAWPLSFIYSEMVLLMGLATGIDYALFVVTRFRHERRAGLPREEALRVATGTSGKAVVFAGTTVLLAICGMFVVGDPTFTSLGTAAIVVVALAVVISVTLLPALLALLGDNIDRLTIPFLREGGGEGGGIWGFITDRVLARPAIIASVTLVVLLAVAAPIFTFNLGFNGAKGLPDGVQAKKALLSLEQHFTLGLTSPAAVVVDAGKDKNVYAPEVQAGVERLTSMVQAETKSAEDADAPFGAPIQTEVNDAGDTEVLRIPINADTGEQKAVDAVNQLRNDFIPASFGPDVPAKAQVTGDTAGNVDFRSKINQRTPIVFAFVLSLAFLVLLLTFRSIVIAVKAIILNLLSVGAAYGLLVLVFQRGWALEKVLSFQATGIIESWLPLFLFAILFGLSMDYHMFVLGRIKEAYERGAHSDEAVSIGIKATAGTITSAAAIMVAVAVIFAFTRNIGIKQFGFGLAAAILIDATVIRSILLPASMKLLGDLNWYLPKWLEWLPHIRMAE